MRTKLRDALSIYLNHSLYTNPEIRPSDEELAAQIAISRVESVPLRLRIGLLERFGSATGVLSASETVLLQVGLSHLHTAAFSSIRDLSEPLREIKDLRSRGFDVITLAESRYPARLRQIATPPLVLFSRGALNLVDHPVLLAVVGSRHMSEYGARVLERLIPPLVHSRIGIVSGMAMGVDARAHEICLKHGGVAIAVQAQGINRAYPAINSALYKDVASCGLVLSEFSHPPAYFGREMFPRRNRIVSGLSNGVLVVEAKEKSGSLITAHFALAQNRDVFAVPGSVFNETSRGCLKLIGEGAKPVLDADDILSELAERREMPLFSESSMARPCEQIAIPADEFVTPLERKIFAFCSEESRTVDEIFEHCGEPIPFVTATLTKMQLIGALKEEKSGIFSLGA